MTPDPQWITPDWPAPDCVKALVTTRKGGYSAPPFAGWNIADHVGDRAADVAANRRLLRERLLLPAEPMWLRQVHGCSVVTSGAHKRDCTADAVVAERPERICAVLTADCLPVLLCDRQGTKVAAVHAGWRGLVAGVIESTLVKMNLPGNELLAWLGPAIGPNAFQVGDDVRAAFIRADSQARKAFVADAPGHWWADIYMLARQRLGRYGVCHIGGGEYCTVSDSEHFYSYRRDGVTGRMATLIWTGS